MATVSGAPWRVAGHEFVYGKLLIGDKGGRSRLLAALAEELGCGYRAGL
jgi:hypothetical protein